MQGNQPNNEEQQKALSAANNMRDAIGRNLSEAQRNSILWGIALLLASAIFAFLTSAPLRKFTGEPFSAYLIGVFLHLTLGLSMHGWKLAVAHRKSPALYILFVILLALAILVIAYFRAVLRIERGQPVLGAYLVSLFMALLEVVVPTLIGVYMANAWLGLERLKREYEWASRFAQSMIAQLDRMHAWRDAVYTRRNEIRTTEKQINDWQREREAARARHDWNRVRQLDEEIAKAENEIRFHRDCLTYLEEWHPGKVADLQEQGTVPATRQGEQGGEASPAN